MQQISSPDTLHTNLTAIIRPHWLITQIFLANFPSIYHQCQHIWIILKGWEFPSHKHLTK